MKHQLTGIFNPADDAFFRNLPGDFRKLKRAAKAHVASRHSQHPLPVASHFVLDRESGVLQLQFECRPTLDLVAQVVGTYDHDQRFIWALDHPAFPANLQQAACVVSRVAKQKNIPELLPNSRKVTMAQVNVFAEITAFLVNADGVFLGDRGDGELVSVVWFYGNKTVG